MYLSHLKCKKLMRSDQRRNRIYTLQGRDPSSSLRLITNFVQTYLAAQLFSLVAVN